MTTTFHTNTPDTSNSCALGIFPDDGRCTIKTSDLKYGSRFRKDLGSIVELVESIKKNGLLCPIGVTRNGLLVHGARRLLSYKQAFPDADQIPCYIIDIPIKENGEIEENLSRKGFSAEELLAIKKYRESIEPNYQSKTQFSRNNQPRSNDKGKVSHTVDQRRDERIARGTGYSYKSLHKLEQIAEASQAFPESFNDLLGRIDGGMKINKAWKLVQNHKKITELRAQPRLVLPTSCNLILGDCRSVDKEIQNSSVDMIFTDPPYNQEALLLYEWLGSFALRILKPGGSLMTIVPHYALPQIFDLMREPMTEGLKYMHVHAILHTGGAAIQHNSQVFVGWKPILEFVKGDGKLRTPDFIMRDCVVVSHPPDKALHPWAQSQIEAAHFISKRTVEGDIVVDPFLGSAAFGVAALSLKRQFIGIEIDSEFFEWAKDRISEYQRANRAKQEARGTSCSVSREQTILRGQTGDTRSNEEVR